MSDKSLNETLALSSDIVNENIWRAAILSDEAKTSVVGGSVRTGAVPTATLPRPSSDDFDGAYRMGVVWCR